MQPQSLRTFGATLSFPIWFFYISWADQNKSFSWNLPELSIHGAGQSDRGYGNENAAIYNRLACAVNLLPVAASAPAAEISLKSLLKCTWLHNEIENKQCVDNQTFSSPFVFFPFGIPRIANVGRDPARLLCRTTSKENLHRAISLKDSRNWKL